MHIGLVLPAQCEPLVDLLCEVNAFYNPEAPAPRDTVRQHVLQNLLSATSPHQLVVATRHDGVLAGLAAITKVHSLVEPEPERRHHLQLKELFVSQAERGQGVGLALMKWVARFALEHHCHRMDWPVKAANLRGQAFYRRLGAHAVEDRLSFRMAEPRIRALAKAIDAGA